ncbi:LOW QUALITY PROTEIN: rho GTPase-activating protein 18-like [Dendronephthya gigantea]|uniref:LOW QUALITY PROTEIN: rho GTPase-activating protein 18-like n=1 Tax=Dendronephthya gigantea TaxID=151771 RepID=UPI00106C4C4C|nr:LOW QUALITY PROTEIN: rho GTPase-activating protein 18-like [Dendronephthya gigantea]
MAKPVKRGDGQAQRIRHLDLDMFWKEYESIEPRVEEPNDEEDDHLNELEHDVQWLEEAGFDSIVKNYRNSKEITTEDLNLGNITSSLTKKQAEAVKRRVNKLNAKVKERLSLQETSQGPQRLTIPEASFQNNNSKQRVDVRSLFPAQTVGETSNKKTSPLFRSRHSYSEGVPLARSQVVKYPGMTGSHSQDHLNDVKVVSPVKVVTTGGNVPTQPVSRPVILTPGNPSPKMRRQTADFAAQLTGKGLHTDTAKAGQSQSPGGSPGDDRRKLGGSLFYITAVNKNSPSPSEASVDTNQLRGLSLSNNWQLSSRKGRSSASPNKPPKSSSAASTPDQELAPRPELNDLPEDMFKEVATPNEKPTVDTQKNSNQGNRPKFPNLPNFTLSRDEYGVTRVDDLSAKDMEKVRSLALIELTALFEQNNLVFHRRKPNKRKTKENGVFGVPLLHPCQRDRGENSKFNTPVILEEMIAFLENNGINEEGILRVPGSAARIRAMREEIEEKYQECLFSWTGRKTHDVAALLKQFLRELPFPLLTYEYQPTFASVEEIQDRVQQLQALNLLVLLLPVAHRDTLQLLLLFLCRIISKQKENKMDLNNVAMIMAPNLFLSTGNKSGATLREVEMAKGTINIVRMLIKYHAILWTVPSFMVRQVRFLYEVEQSGKAKEGKGKKRKAKRGASDPAINAVNPIKKSLSLEDLDRIEHEFENHIIRVKAPSLKKVAMALQLSKNTKARDVVEKFCKASPKYKEAKLQNALASSQQGHSQHKANKCSCGDDHFLFEVGGNIGERCLDMETNLLQLSRLNPHAEWVVKIKN